MYIHLINNMTESRKPLIMVYLNYKNMEIITYFDSNE